MIYRHVGGMEMMTPIIFHTSWLHSTVGGPIWMMAHTDKVALLLVGTLVKKKQALMYDDLYIKN